MIEGLYPAPAEPAMVAEKPTLFWTYFCLGAALYHRLVSFVASLPVPAHAAKYPLMRTSHGTDAGLVLSWLILGSGENQEAEVLRQVQLLSDDEMKLSNLGIISFPDLQEAIQEQYRPEKDPVMLRAQRHWTEVARKEAEAPQSASQPRPPG